MIIRSSISVRILNTTNMSWQKKRLFSVFLRTWLGSNLGHREQQRQRHNLGVVATSSVIALVRTNERPWRGWSIMTSCLRWRTWMCVNESLSAQFFEGTPKTELLLLLLLLLAATGCCWLRCLLLAVAVAGCFITGIRSIQQQQSAIEAYSFPFFRALLLRCRITHAPPGSALVAFTVRQ